MVKFANMAFSKGIATSDNTNFKRYIGVGTVKVVAVCPTAEEIKAIYDRQEVGEEPSYLGEYEGVKTARLDFIIQTLPEKNNGIESTNHLHFSLRDEYRFNMAKDKVQVIDKYGRTAWATVNRDIAFNPNDSKQFKVLGIPVYANGPANLDKEFRPMYVGEEALENFIRTLLNVPMTRKYVNGEWIEKTGKELEDCEAILDNIKDYFKGDFSEIKNVLAYQPNNSVKILFGVKTIADGKMFTDVYTQMFLSPRAKSYDRLKSQLQSDKEAGRYPNTEFEVCDLKEYNPTATAVGDMPADICGDMPMQTNAWFD